MAPEYKLGGFIGYHFVDEQFNAFGCTQTAGNPEICSAGQVAPGNLTISDSGTWQSLRMGLAGQLMLPAGFSLRAEGAWLPLMSFAGGNNHWLREPSDFNGTIPEKGTGFNGIQAEGEIDYALSPNFDVGAGARFWSFNAKGHVLFQDVTLGGEPQVATIVSEPTTATAGLRCPARALAHGSFCPHSIGSRFALTDAHEARIAIHGTPLPNERRPSERMDHG
jgi:hypothetical protein